MNIPMTGSQTVGPYFAIGLAPMYITDLAGPDVQGEHITITGRVLDGEDRPVPDAVVEIWQADANGTYASEDLDKTTPPFRGFGRVPTDGEGRFRFTTIRPGRVPGPDGQLQAPHLVALIGMRGLLRHLITRLYFPDEPSNAEDLVLSQVPEERRATLIMRAQDPGMFTWDICLQGPNETVFFDA